MQGSYFDLERDNSNRISKGMCSKVNKILGKEVVLFIFRTILSEIGNLSFLRIFFVSLTIKGGFRSSFDLVCLLGARTFSP